ncbi:hypothetical protein [Bdellovibrio reynosensis]|uniref:Uncharacterized protein n=1 Tax=Bdellovibrio reynosensis TaxID=2835041 RepID=A0ABY4C4P4_9BACT|nr:hypothetical protein [Bdellovibrio reynosensis]UOE99929.1 hypothetical protein MNR06_09485 [Bdellovibrio reynosensis]
MSYSTIPTVECADAANPAQCVADSPPIYMPATPQPTLPQTGPVPTSRPANPGSTASSNNNRNNSAPRSNSAQSSGPSMSQQCQAEYQSYYDECSKEIESTSYSCDEKNDQGMTGVADSASQMALMLGQQTSSNVQAACGQMANFSQAANAAVAAYRINCGSAISSCKSKCKLIEEYVRGNPSCGPYFLGGNSSSVAALAHGQDLAKGCNNFDAKMNQAQQAIQNYGNTAANASQCENLSKGDPTTASPELCKTNPTAPGCVAVEAVDCNNPTIATTNKVCVCAKNPSDPMCFNQQNSAGGGALANSGGIDSSSRMGASSNNSDMNFDGDIPGLPRIDQAEYSSGGPDDAVDGRQGNGPGIGGFGTGGGSGITGAGQNSSENLDRGVAEASGEGGGFYGGGGFKPSSSSSGEGGGSGGSAAPGSASGKNAGPPDLRQFLPGGKLDPRSMSGLSGRDGITGPGSDIWQKIQNRYRVLSHTLMP